MKQITAISNDAKQNMTFVLDDGSRVDFYIEYISCQKGWFMSLTYGDVVINGRRMVNSPNMLRQFRDFLPFGLACVVIDGGEPIYIDDFSEAKAILYLLNGTC